MVAKKKRKTKSKRTTPKQDIDPKNIALPWSVPNLPELRFDTEIVSGQRVFEIIYHDSVLFKSLLAIEQSQSINVQEKDTGGLMFSCDIRRVSEKDFSVQNLKWCAGSVDELKFRAS